MNVHTGIEQRPWPLPRGPWIMEQTWHHLLFAHWPVAPEALRAVVPEGLTVDTFGGQAWLGAVAFRLSGIRLRVTPPMPLVSRFPEINLRTYVTRDGKPGVLFLSLDADNRLGIALARPWFRLPYFEARIGFQPTPEGIRFTCRRVEEGAPDAAFTATYRPAGPAFRAAPGSLARWLTDRYCYYSAESGRLVRCEIHHAPWPLQPAVAAIAENTLADGHGLCLPATAPLLHYARYIQAVIWPARPVERRARGVRRYEVPSAA